jgi:hypothetical protein
MRYLGTFFCLLVGSQFLACGKEREPAMSPAASTVQDREEVAHSLATEHCKRARDCNKIGPRAEFQNWQHCMNSSLADARDKLSDCRYGIKSKDLQECLSDIQDQDCGAGFGGVTTAIACRAAELCLD